MELNKILGPTLYFNSQLYAMVHGSVVLSSVMMHKFDRILGSVNK
jgi:hypothetical protein